MSFELLRVQREVMKALSACDRPAEVSSLVLKAIGDGLGWLVGVMWEIEGPSLVARELWRASPSIGAALVAVTSSAKLASGEDLPGTVWATKQPLWVPQLTSVTAGDRLQVALEASLRCCLLIPIVGRTRIVGVLELFGAALPNETHLEELVAIGRSVGVSMEKCRERNALESVLKFSQDKLARLHASELIGLAVADTAGLLIEANDTFLAMLQRARPDLDAGRIRWDEMTPPACREADARALAELRTTGRVRALEKEFERPDGSRIAVLIGCASLDPQATHLISFVVDISRQKAVERELAGVNRELEGRIAAVHRELSALSEHLEEVREDKHTQLSREIHDELGQQLTGLKLDASWTLRRLRHEPPEIEPASERLVAMLGSVDGLLASVRRIATELRPGMLDLGLIPTLEWYTRETAARSGLVIDLAVSEDVEAAVEGKLAMSLYRILQELVTNVIRHAQARRIQIALTVEAGALRLAVSDDGIGIAAGQATRPTSLGLRGIRERARGLCGTFTIGGAQGGGTLALLTLPVGARP